MHPFKLPTALFLLIFTFSFSLFSQEKPSKYKRLQYFPKEQTSADPELIKTIKLLKEAAAKKDAKILLSLVGKDVKCGFGGEDGIENFKKNWNLISNPKQSEIWAVLKKILPQGGHYENQDGMITYTIPAAHTYQIPDDYASIFTDETGNFSYGMIFGKNVNVREKPSSQSKVIEVLNQDVVKFILVSNEEPVYETINGEKSYWAKIQTYSGKTGYVFERFVWNAYDWRMGFEKIKGKWLIHFFVSGD